MKIPAPFFIELLKNVNFSPLYYGIPAANIDLELFKLLSRYLKMNRISNESILDMVRAINIQDMDFKQIHEFVSGFPSLRSFPCFTGVSSNMQVLSEDRNTSESKYTRRFSRSHQQFSVNIDFREYIPAYSRPRCILVHLSNDLNGYILGISIQYTMIDKIRNCGTTDLPNSNTARLHNFLLEENEIVNHIRYGPSSKESLLQFVEFYTNYGRHVRFGSPNRYRVIHSEEAPEQNSYFHSFDIEKFPKRLRCIWVQYKEHMKMNGNISFIEIQDRRNINGCAQVTLLSKIPSFFSNEKHAILKMVHLDLWISIKIMHTLMTLTAYILRCMLTITKPVIMPVMLIIELALEPQEFYKNNIITFLQMLTCFCFGICMLIFTAVMADIFII